MYHLIRQKTEDLKRKTDPTSFIKNPNDTSNKHTTMYLTKN